MIDHVHPALARALDKRGYETLTPVQSAVVEPGIQESDLIVSAQTGSGKTVAFGLTLAHTLLGGGERLDKAGDPLALIIAPTRELALQVARELEWLFAEAGARIATCVGGMDPFQERRALNFGAHIVVGTPGRLSDHIRRGALVLDKIRAVVLDEADEMLNLGFREELEHILDSSPVERRSLMFSATMPRAIETMARTYMRDAVRVNTVSEQKQHGDIEYRALNVASHDSENAIFNVLRFFNATNALVFCNTRMAVNRLSAQMIERGISVVALSGELSQNARNHALQALRDHRAQVCVATDVAARGIDLPDLELVIHAELPKNTESLLHRSGRTGRAGRKGASVLIVPQSARRRTERLLQDARIDARWGKPPSADDVKRKDDKRLLEDSVLSEPIQESEQTIVQQLLAAHGAEAIAAAFVRTYRKGQAAPEDLAPVAERAERVARHDRADRAERGPRREREERDNSPREFGKRERRDREGPRPSHFEAPGYTGGVWISLSVGRNKSAEPRWLIPMLCKAGGISKSDIGSIRIQQNETLVELYPANADAFFEAIGDGKLEKSIYVSRLDEAPRYEAPEVRNERPQRAPRYEAAEAHEERPQRAPRREFAEKPYPKKARGARTDERPAWDPVRSEARREAQPDFRREKPARPRPGDAPHAFAKAKKVKSAAAKGGGKPKKKNRKGG